MLPNAIQFTHRPVRGYLAQPNGYCAGVYMAIKALVWMTKLFPPPVYCYHEIVHNGFVVDTFKQAGVVFVDSIDEVPEGAPVMLSAHGSSPTVISTAQERSGIMVDSVCPLVTKVHHEVNRRAAKGYDIIFVGHENHDEAVGTVARAPSHTTLVEPETGLGGFRARDSKKVALFAQTTLGLHEWEEVQLEALKRFPDLEMSRKSDLCYATTNRQDAVRKMSSECDLILVVGSDNSSNTNALVRTARTSGKAAHRIDSIKSIQPEWMENVDVVGVTAGASAPDHLVQEVLKVIDPVEGWQPFRVTEEDEYFPLPHGLRTLLDSVSSMIRIGLTARADVAGIIGFDRTTTAMDALTALDFPVAV
ncbi:MAG: 4-hydroxy-3-methylbut-2-enyl diphosphate reductase [bacterium]|nr:4-hydroxy-3-methylbut-2-enyl diphosphate reductase [bacterium]MCY3652760.1 4-hydroxy-3-methylbut-2-enyl diphosphate reductase [bacterium]